jgi:hypothetical protein
MILAVFELRMNSCGIAGRDYVPIRLRSPSTVATTDAY